MAHNSTMPLKKCLILKTLGPQHKLKISDIYSILRWKNCGENNGYHTLTQIISQISMFDKNCVGHF